MPYGQEHQSNKKETKTREKNWEGNAKIKFYTSLKVNHVSYENVHPKSHIRTLKIRIAQYAILNVLNVNKTCI